MDERAGTLGEAERFASLLAELRDAERRVTDMASPPDEEEAAELQELLDAVNRVDVYQGEDDELRAQLKQIDLGRADAEAVARTARALGDGPGSAEMALGLAKRRAPGSQPPAPWPCGWPTWVCCRDSGLGERARLAAGAGSSTTSCSGTSAQRRTPKRTMAVKRGRTPRTRRGRLARSRSASARRRSIALWSARRFCKKPRRGARARAAAFHWRLNPDSVSPAQRCFQRTSLCPVPQDAVERFASTLEATSPMTREEVMARLREIEKLAKRYSERPLRHRRTQWR